MYKYIKCADLLININIKVYLLYILTDSKILNNFTLFLTIKISFRLQLTENYIYTIVLKQSLS